MADDVLWGPIGDAPADDAVAGADGVEVTWGPIGASAPAKADAKPKKKSGVGDSMMRGLGNVVGSTGRAAREAGIPGAQVVEDAGETLAADHPASVNTLSDIIHDPLQAGKEGVAEAVPQVGITMGGAAAGAAGGAALGSVVPGLGTIAGGVVGAGVGAFAPNFVQEFGGILQSQDETGHHDTGKAAMGAAAAASIDMLGPETSIPRMIAGKGLKALAEHGAGGILSRTAKGALVEGGTEAVQTGIERASAGQDLTGQDAIDDYAVSATKGAAGGGAIEAGAHVASGRGKSKLDADHVIGSPSDLLTPNSERVGNPDYQTPSTSRDDLFAVDGLPDLDTVLSKGIRPVETGDNPEQVSKAGAVGAHQLLPSTAKEMAAKLGVEYDETKLLKDPAYNAKLARAYMETLSDRYNGDMFKAITAYHAGPGNVDSWIKRFGDPNEVGQDAWLSEVEKAGAVQSAAYTRNVYANLGRGVEDGQGGPVAADTTTPEDATTHDALDANTAQGAILSSLRGAATDDTGATTVKPAQLVKLSAELSTKLKNADIDGANEAIAKQHDQLAKKLEAIQEQQQALDDASDQHSEEEQARYQAQLDRAKAGLRAQTVVLNHATRIVSAVHQELSTSQGDLFQAPAAPAPVAAPVAEPTLITEPGPAPVPLIAEPKPSGAPLAEDTSLADNLKTEHANTMSAVTQVRQKLLDKVLSDPETRNPTRRYIAELKRHGLEQHVDATEAEQIAGHEDKLQQAQPPPEVIPSAPDESDNFGIPERKPRETAPVAEPPAAAPVEAAAPKAAAAPVETNVHTRAQAHAETLGTSKRAWFMRGVDREMGTTDAPAPTSPSKAAWFDEGRAFVAQETAHQQRERTDAAPPADRTPARVAAKPSPAAPKTTKGDELKAKVAAKNAEPKTDTPARGGHNKFVEAVAKAEQDGKLDNKTGAQLRYMADAAWDQDMWRAMDDAIGQHKPGATKFSRSRAIKGEVLDSPEQVAGDLRAILDDLGLHDVAMRLTTRVSLYMSSGVRAEGQFQPKEDPSLPKEIQGVEHLISIAMDGSAPVHTLTHEVVHALRELRLFTPAEWEALTKYATKLPELKDFLAQYDDLSDSQVTEEAVAEAYANWETSKVKPVGLARQAIQKIGQLLDAIKRAFNMNGFRDAEAIFQAISSGEIGSRPRGETRVEGLLKGKDLAVYRRTPAAKAEHVMLTNIQDAAIKTWMGLTNTEDLALAAKKLLPSAMRFIRANSKSHALARQFEDRLSDIKRAYVALPDRLKGNGKGSINEMLDDMTADGKWGYLPTWNPKAKLDVGMKARFDRMPAEAQAVIKSVLLFNHEAREHLNAATIKAANAEYDPLIEKAKADGDTEAATKLEKEKRSKLAVYTRQFDAREDTPYSPRARSGDFVATGMSAEYLKAKQANDKAALATMRSEPKHYWVRFFDSLGEAEAAALRTRGTAYPFTEHFQRDKASPLQMGGDDTYLAFNMLRTKVQAMLRDDPNDTAAQRLYQLATDMYLHALADTSARKGELRSDRVAGKDPVTGEALDMFRAFVSRGQATAHFVASLSNSKEIYDSIEAMKDEAASHTGKNNNDRADAERFSSALMWHYVENLNRQPNRNVEKLLRLNSILTLMLKPGYHLQNATQTIGISLPQIAAVSSYPKAWAEVLGAYKEVLPLVNGWLSGRLDIRKITDPVTRQLAQDLQDRGRLGTGLSMELGSWEANGNGILPKTWNAIDTAMRQLPQNIEDVNRLVAGIAAFRAMKSRGKSTEAATEFASKVIAETHGDYSHFNTPKAMKVLGELERIPTQYRKFQLIMAALNVKMFHNAFTSKDVTKEQRGIARVAMAYTMAHQIALAGLKGAPAAALIGGLTMALLGKDPDDWDDKLKEKLEAFFGKDNPMVGILHKGAPYEYLKADLSTTLGMGTVFSPLPYTDLPKTSANKTDFMAVIGEILGGSVAGTLWKAQQSSEAMAQGDMYQAMAAFAPGVVGGALKANKMRDQGVTATNGDVLIKPEDVTELAKIYTMLGLPSAQLTDASEARSKKYETEHDFSDKTTLLKRKYAAAYKAGDTDKLGAIRDDWKAMQEERVALGLKRQPMATLLKAPAEQRKRERHTTGGVPYTKSDRKFVEELTD